MWDNFVDWLGEHVVLAIAGGLAILAAIITPVVMYHDQIGDALARLTYSSPEPGQTVSVEATEHLVEQGDGAVLAEADYWPAHYVNRYWGAPGRDDVTGDVALWVYCPPPRIASDCADAITEEHPGLIVSGEYDPVNETYTAVRLIGVVIRQGDNGSFRCSLPDGQSFDNVGKINEVFALLGDERTSDGFVHTVYLEENVPPWVCEGE